MPFWQPPSEDTARVRSFCRGNCRLRREIVVGLETDNKSDSEYVILTWGIRDINGPGTSVTFEQSIPLEKYDGFKLLDIIAGTTS